MSQPEVSEVSRGFGHAAAAGVLVVAISILALRAGRLPEAFAARHGLAPDGFLLEAEMGDRWPLHVEVVEVSYGLPAQLSERPSDSIPRPGWWTDTTMVKTGFTL